MIQSFLQGIRTQSTDIANGAVDIVKSLVSGITSIAGDLLVTGHWLLIRLLDGITEAAPNLLSGMSSIIISAIVDVWSAFNWINLGKNAITFLKDGIVGMINAVKGAGKNVLEGITGAMSNLPNTLKGLGKNGIEFLQSGITGMKGKAIEAAKGILEAIMNNFKSLPSKLLEVGKNIVQGLWNGMKNMNSWMVSKVKEFAGSILKGIKDALGIHSPSTVFRDMIGKNLVKGIAVGVDVETPNLQETLENNINNVTAGLQAHIPTNAIEFNLQKSEINPVPINLGGVHFHIDTFNNSSDKDMRQLVEESMEIAEEYIRRRGEVFA